MALSIKNPRAEELAKAVSLETGETYTEAVVKALDARLTHIRGLNNKVLLKASLVALAEQIQHMPDLDCRSADQILGYDTTGGF